MLMPKSCGSWPSNDSYSLRNVFPNVFGDLDTLLEDTALAVQSPAPDAHSNVKRGERVQRCVCDSRSAGGEFSSLNMTAQPSEPLDEDRAPRRRKINCWFRSRFAVRP